MSAINFKEAISGRKTATTLRKLRSTIDIDKRNLVPSDKQSHCGEAVRRSYPSATTQRTNKEEVRSYLGEYLVGFVVRGFVVSEPPFSTPYRRKISP